MTEPPIKKVNTIALKFDEGQRSKPKARYICRDVFKVQSRDVIGVGFEGKYSILVKFRTSAVYDKVCELHHGHTYDVPTGEHVTKVKVINVSTYSVKVTMKNLPFKLINT